ncbi:hypothetical protein ACFWIZ_27100, partial [Streptomyces sp. NPDC127044]
VGGVSGGLGVVKPPPPRGPPGPGPAGPHVYLCGPPAMARDLYGALRAAGVPDRRIHHESFEL